MREGLKILIDWLTISSRVHDAFEMQRLLGFRDVAWELRGGRYGYNYSLYYDHINIYFSDDKSKGVCLEMSGQGCRRFESDGARDYEFLFDLVFKNENFMNITRLDIACDDTVGYLPLPLMKDKIENREYSAPSRSWKVTNSSKGLSLEVGSVQSDVQIVIYDKARERGFDDGRHWVRCELRLRDQRSLKFAMDMLGGVDIGKEYAGVVLNYLRFVDMENSRLKNCPTCAWWTEFLGTTEKIKIYEKPGVEYNLSRLELYVFSQAGGSIDAYIKMFGVTAFMMKLREELVNRQYEMKDKHKKLLNEYGSHEERLHNRRAGGGCGSD